MSEKLTSFEQGKDQELSIHATAIPGMLVIDKKTRFDDRGWFMETWQREEMMKQGLPDIGPVQMNLSHNDSRGVLRGIHTEPWDKYIGIINGEVFVAFVDLREGDSFGATHYQRITPGTSVFVPRGVGNSYLTLTDNVDYAYLVNAHWRPGNTYPALRYDDPQVSIPWPIPTSEMLISDKDAHKNPYLTQVTPMKPRKTLVTGAGGQVGRALAGVLGNADFFDRSQLDIDQSDHVARIDWNSYSSVVNAAAYTKVDLAETERGATDAWSANAVSVARLAQAAGAHGKTLVHISSDYVFDGTQATYTELSAMRPLSVYGQSKAAGDVAVSALEKHYNLRTSWVIGDGNNFVRTMIQRALQELPTSVVDDQLGRPTFADSIALGIDHLLREGADYGTYNLTGEGRIVSWYNLARIVFEQVGAGTALVAPVSTEEYFRGKQHIAPRPALSHLSTDKIRRTGFTAPNWEDSLVDYVQKELAK